MILSYLSEELSRKKVAVRKRHLCVWCGEELKQGDMAVRFAYVFENSCMTDHYHPECFEAIRDADVDWDIGFNAHEFRRGSTYCKDEIDEGFV